MLHFHIIANNYVFAAGFTIWRSNASPHRRLCQECDVDSQVNIGEGGQKGIFSCRSRVQKLAFVSQWKRIYRSKLSFPWRCIDPDIWHKKLSKNSAIIFSGIRQNVKKKTRTGRQSKLNFLVRFLRFFDWVPIHVEMDFWNNTFTITYTDQNCWSPIWWFTLINQ